MAKWRNLAALTAAVLISSCMAVPGATAGKSPAPETEASGYPGNEAIEKIFAAQELVQSGADRSEGLDKAFLSGSVLLSETSADSLNADPSPYNAVIRSISPTGRSALLWNEEENQAYAVYEGVTSPVLPADGRGAEDTYGKRSNMFISGLLSHWVGKEGVTWSHNGQYAVITSFRMGLILMYFHDPLIIDTATGDAFLPGTWPDNPMKNEEAATAVTACFSLDDQYLYFIQYGKAQASLYSLYRYCIDSDELALCWTGETEVYYPRIYETSGEEVIGLYTPIAGSQEYGICRFKPSQDGFEADVFSFGQSLASSTLLPRDLAYSSDSGFAVSKMESPSLESGFGNIFFQCYRPDQDFEGYDRLCALPVEGSTVTEFSYTEIQAIPKKDLQTAYYAIYLMRLSPDGYYALALARDRMADTKKLLLIDLENMTYKEVGGIDAGSIDLSLMDNDPVIEWNSDVLLVTTKEGIKTYAFR